MQYSTARADPADRRGQGRAARAGRHLHRQRPLPRRHAPDGRALRACRSTTTAKLFCWLQNTGHWPDIGGMVPGGFSAHATEVEQEGLRLPPVKLFKRGEMDREIFSIISSNIRDRRPAHRRHQRAGGGAEGRRAAADGAARSLRRRDGDDGDRGNRASAPRSSCARTSPRSPTASIAPRPSSTPTGS